MPAVMAMPMFWAAVAGTAAGAGQIYSAKKQGSAQKESLAVETDYNTRALAAEREQLEYDRQRNTEKDRLAAEQVKRDLEQQAWDNRRLEEQTRQDLAQRAFEQSLKVENENQSRRSYGDFVQTLEPYRAAGISANTRLAQLLGINLPAYTGGNYYDLARNASQPVAVTPLRQNG